jgi:hypothetical protein
LGSILGREPSLTGQLRDREGRGGHLAAVGALGAGAERATALTQLRPLTVAVDEDAALIEDAVEKERRVFLDPDKMREIDPAAADPLQTGGQVESGNEAIAGERDQQVQVGVRVVVAASQRAVEHGETDAALGAQRPAKLGEQLPVGAQVVTLAGGEPQPAWAEPVSTQSALRGRTAQGALLGTEIECQFLDRTHVEP